MLTFTAGDDEISFDPDDIIENIEQVHVLMCTFKGFVLFN